MRVFHHAWKCISLLPDLSMSRIQSSTELMSIHVPKRQLRRFASLLRLHGPPHGVLRTPPATAMAASIPVRLSAGPAASPAHLPAKPNDLSTHAHVLRLLTRPEYCSTTSGSVMRTSAP